MRARILWSTIVMCLLLKAVSAQVALPSAPLQMGLPGVPPLMRAPNPLPPSGVRQTPLPALLSPRPDLFRAAPQTFAPTFDQPPAFDPRFFPCCGSFVGPVFGGPFAGHVFVPGTSRRAGWSVRPVPQAGYLRLLVQPETAQVHVDGFYMGTVLDVRRLVTLEPGSYRVELRARGYESVTFDVRIAPNETITYRTDLRPIAPAEPPVAAAPPPPKTFYVIPNCYAGDRRPERAALPSTCDIAKLRTIPPVLNTLRPTPSAR